MDDGCPDSRRDGHHRAYQGLGGSKSVVGAKEEETHARASWLGLNTSQPNSPERKNVNIFLAHIILSIMLMITGNLEWRT